MLFGCWVAQGIRVALTDGAAHAVDSSEMAFKLACQYAFRCGCLFPCLHSASCFWTQRRAC
jgi:translation elongation factor EF-G